MSKVNRNGEVWVYAEQEDGHLADVSLELLSKARELAATLGVSVGAAVLGDHVDKAAGRLVAYGADSVYHVEHPLLRYYQSATHKRVLVDLINEHQPQIVLFGATAIGRELAPAVAGACGCGLTADCTDLQVGNHTDPRSKTEHENVLLQIRPAFGGSIIATIVNPENWPQMATVREGVMVMPTPDTQREGNVVRIRPSSLDGYHAPLHIVEIRRTEKKVDLKGARVIVAGGAGVGTKRNFKLIHELANCLGAAVGASRAAVDLGFADHDHLVGQTGTTVRPALYVACGISGAVQHRAGMEEAAKVVAINTDPKAPIFQVAHFGIVGDLNVVIPKLISAIRKGADIEQAVSG
jgi:electron transfer flavoprotein alpha subunit